MIKIENLCYKANKKGILKDINITLPCKGFYAIYGPSGAGKSVLLNIINLNITDYTGKLLFNDLEISSLNQNDIENFRVSNIVQVFQKNELIENLSLKDNIKYFLNINNKDIDDDDYYFYLKKFKLEERENIKAINLSGGERQRVCILRCLLLKPKILLLDEPTSWLDEKTANDVLTILKEVSKKNLVIITTHQKTLTDKFIDDYINIDNGKITKDVNKKIVESADYDTKDIKKKFPTKLFKNNLLISCVTSIIFIILIVIASILSSLDINDVVYRLYDNYDANYISIKSKDSYGYFTETDYDLYNGPLDYYKTYKIPLLYTGVYHPDTFENNILNVHPGTYLINTVVIDESLNDYELIMTDYQIKFLIKDGIIDCKTIKEAIGYTFYYGYDFIIKDVRVTTYNDDILFKDWYDTVICNYESFIKLRAISAGEIYVNDYKATSIYTHQGGTYGLIKEEFDYYDIALPYVLLEKTYGPSYQDKIYELYGSSINLEVGGKTYTFKIKGRDYLYNSYVFSNDFFKDHLDDFTVKNLECNTSIHYNNKEEFTYFYNTYMYETMFEKEADLIHDLNKIKSISNIVLPFLVILFITSITSISYFLMSKNKKKIALCLAYGLRRKDIKKYLYLKNTALILLLWVCSFAFFFIFCFLFNNYLYKNYSGINLVRMNKFILLSIVCGLFILLNILNSVIKQSVFKKDLYSLLNE